MSEWTWAVEAELKRLWKAGVATAEIGRLLKFSKNSIVGKAHRMGLPARPSPIRRGGQKPQAATRQRSEKAAKHILSTTLALSPAVVIPDTRAAAAASVRAPARRRIQLCCETEDRPCSWPIGVPKTPGFRFCDADCVRGRSYCPEHCGIAYVQPRDRREDTV